MILTEGLLISRDTHRLCQ